MARGITEKDVHDAAYELVVAGERPTVERIRAHLGTGSPNTVIRHLDSWWHALGTRLEEEGSRAPLPNAPPALARLAGEWWAAALRAATDQANAELAAARAAMDAERNNLSVQEQARRADLERVEADAATARQERAIAEQRLRDTQQLVEQQRTQLADLTDQRDRAIDRAARLEAELTAHTARLAAREEEDARSRAQNAEHLRAVENRAHAEVDRARQDIRSLQKELDATRQAHQNAIATQRDREAALQERVTEAVRDAAVASAEIAALKRRKPGSDSAGKQAAPKKPRKASTQGNKTIRRSRTSRGDQP